MAVKFKENKAIFTEVATIEEAEKVFEWILTVKEPVIDMTECSHMHTSVLQLLTLFKPDMELPEDEELKQWIK